MHTKAKGNMAEERGAEYLRKNGFRILDRNVYNRFGEIDIISFRDDVIHFVEVKSATSYEQAINNITPQNSKNWEEQSSFIFKRKNSTAIIVSMHCL